MSHRSTTCPHCLKPVYRDQACCDHCDARLLSEPQSTGTWRRLAVASQLKQLSAEQRTLVTGSKDPGRLARLARQAQQSGDLARAEEMCRLHLLALASRLSPDHVALLPTLELLAQVCQQRSAPERAEVAWHEAARILDYPNPWLLPVDTARCGVRTLTAYALFLNGQARHEQALAIERKASRLRKILVVQIVLALATVAALLLFVHQFSSVNFGY